MNENADPSFQINCPECRSTIEVSAAQVGHKGECPDCEHKFIVEMPDLKKDSAPDATSEKAIRIKCPDCSAPIDVPSSMDGKKGQCPECHTKFIVNIPDPKVDEEVLIDCPDCDAAIKVSRSFDGKKGKCPECHIKFIVDISEDAKTVAQEAPLKPSKKAIEKLKVQCPECDLGIEVAQSLIGAKGKCPECTHKFIIEDPSDFKKASSTDNEALEDLSKNDIEVIREKPPKIENNEFEIEETFSKPPKIEEDSLSDDWDDPYEDEEESSGSNIGMIALVGGLIFLGIAILLTKCVGSNQQQDEPPIIEKRVEKSEITPGKTSDASKN